MSWRSLWTKLYGKMRVSKWRKGKFGANCNFECACKNGATCDAVNGRCICAAGFTGPTCEDTCSTGFYGLNCSKSCDCLNNNMCDPITGKCLCVGWMGEKCERGCPKGYYGPMSIINILVRTCYFEMNLKWVKYVLLMGIGAYSKTENRRVFRLIQLATDFSAKKCMK
ncbi:EGF-like domain protein [Dictyocaulus viviparus]|uniref:EGF-like domain protein n=1 Tax=Dictyocaulus viviparus TaxID=29172 RepID=A0A0D8Y8A0_DICVI|nr:EGF-like domain protein [Dictyocaulus viviparus]